PFQGQIPLRRSLPRPSAWADRTALSGPNPTPDRPASKREAQAIIRQLQLAGSVWLIVSWSMSCDMCVRYYLREASLSSDQTVISFWAARSIRNWPNGILGRSSGLNGLSAWGWSIPRIVGGKCPKPQRRMPEIEFLQLTIEHALALINEAHSRFVDIQVG